jgi:hypothetical protein
MPITQAMCSSFKGQILQALHDFDTSGSGGNTFKLALYTSSANLDASTTAYTSSNEVAASGSYTAGGGTLVNSGVTVSGTTGFTDFSDLSFTTATITARGALIYNNTNSNAAVCVLDFGGDKTSTAGTFSIIFPTPDASNAIIRIA